ncbi:hypothetical protein V2G26_004730 [Clonostachys chloroleuca]
MSSLPKTYKAAVFTGPKAEVKLQDVELKRPGKGQVLVKVIACGVCFSDVAISRGEMGTDLFPRVPGHEIVGDVAAVGPDITSFKGASVSVAHGTVATTASVASASAACTRPATTRRSMA